MNFEFSNFENEKELEPVAAPELEPVAAPGSKPASVSDSAQDSVDFILCLNKKERSTNRMV